MSAELTNVSDNTVIWGQHYSGPASNIIAMQQQIAGDIAGKLRSDMSGTEKQQVTKQGTKDPEAYELYLKGRYEWDKRTPASLTAAIAYFDQAIEKIPTTLWHTSGLADVYGVMPSLRRVAERGLSQVECRCPQSAGVGSEAGPSPRDLGQQ